MIKNISKLSVRVGEKVYEFLCDPDSPTGDVKLALLEILKFVGKVEDTYKEEQAKEDEQSKIEKIDQDVQEPEKNKEGVS